MIMFGNAIGYWQRRGKWNRYKNVASFKLCEQSGGNVRGRGNGPALTQGQHTLAKAGSTHYPGNPDILYQCITSIKQTLNTVQTSMWLRLPIYKSRYFKILHYILASKIFCKCKYLIYHYFLQLQNLQQPALDLKDYRQKLAMNLNYTSTIGTISPLQCLAKHKHK